MNAPESASDHLNLPEYFRLPKHIGEVEPQTLLLIAKDNMRHSNSSSAALRANSASIAASALIEAAITFENPNHDYDDSLIELIDQAESQLLIARSAEEELLDSGHKPHDEFTELIRLEVYSDFANVYKDIICGEVTETTTSELIAALNQRISSLNKHRSTDASNQNIAGLRAELITLREVWLEYSKGIGGIAIPSTLRGGDGTYNNKETHDTVYLDEFDDGFKVVDYEEVKSHNSWRKMKLAIAGRYEARITLVNRKGLVTRHLGSVGSLDVTRNK